MMLLRVILIADAVVLAVLGLLLMLASRAMFGAFGLADLPGSVNYIAGMWGALMATMGIGYGLAARSPATSRVWVQVGIARAILETAVSIIYVAQGNVSMSSAGLGLALAIWFALAYIALYPPKPSAAGSMQ